jgi:twinkle protein
MQLKQFSGVNIEENLSAFDAWADKFEKLPMYYLTFHGAHEVSLVGRTPSCVSATDLSTFFR